MKGLLRPRRALWLVVGLAVAGAAAAVAVAGGGQPADLTFTPKHATQFTNIDVARAWHQWSKPEACYRSLLAAERAAPAEVRYQPRSTA